MSTTFRHWRAAVLFATALPVLAVASGQPDPSFGEDGALIIHADHAQPVGWEYASDLIIDSAGRYVTVGLAYKTNDSDRLMGLITRHRADGTPDPSVGGAGFRHLEWQGQPISFEQVRQTNGGALMVAGFQSHPDGGDIAALLCRLREDGQLDPQFQSGGCRTLEVVHGSRGLSVSGYPKLELLPDGRMLVLGAPVQDPENPEDPRGFALVRLLPNGDDDPTFGDATSCTNPAPRCGIAYSPANVLDAIKGRDVAVDAQGRIVVGAHMNVGTFQLLTVARYTEAGEFEMWFEAMNFDALTGEPETYHYANDVHVLPDGGVMVVGELGILGQPHHAGVARFLADGSHDPGFGTAGRVIDAFDPLADESALATSTLQSDGKLLLVGYSGAPSPRRCHVLRLDASTGARDAAFGDGGVATPATLNALSPEDCYPTAVVTDARNVIVAGASQVLADGPQDFESNVFLLRLGRDDLFRDGFEP